jgi:hypothetical protein
VGPPRTCFWETSGRGLNHQFAMVFRRRQSTNMGMSRPAAHRASISVDKDLRQLSGSGNLAISAAGLELHSSFPKSLVRVMFLERDPERDGKLELRPYLGESARAQRRGPGGGGRAVSMQLIEKACFGEGSERK